MWYDRSYNDQSMQTYTIARAHVWVYPGEGAWHFATIPARETQAIRAAHKGNARAWGSIPVTVTLGSTTWKTSLFPDTKAGAYLLPLKAAVRKKEHVPDTGYISCTLTIE